MASTKKQVVSLQRRSVEILSRSDGGGVTDFSVGNGQQSARGGARSGFSSGFRVDRWQRFGATLSTRGGSSGGVSNSSSSGGSGSNSRKTISGMKGVRGGGVPVKPKAPHEEGVAVASGSVSSEPCLTPALAPVIEGDVSEAPAVFGTKSAANPESVMTRAYAGDGGQGQAGRKEGPGAPDKNAAEQEERTAAGRVGAFLAALPLSKLKIVIGKLKFDLTNSMSFKPPLGFFLRFNICCLFRLFFLDVFHRTSGMCCPD